MTNTLALEVNLDTPIASNTSVYYDHETDEDHVETETKTLGQAIAEQTADKLATTISSAGTFAFGDFAGSSGVNLNKIINDRVEAAIEERVGTLIDGRVTQAILRMGQDLENANVKKRNNTNKDRHWDDDPFIPEEPQAITTLEQVVDALTEDWLNARIEDRHRPQGRYNYPSSSRLEVKAKDAFAPLVDASVKQYLNGLDKELKNLHHKTFAETVEQVREQAVKAVTEATSQVWVTLKDKK